MKIVRSIIIATLFLMSLFLIVIPIAGCGSSTNKATPTHTPYSWESYWRETADGSIETWDAKRLQKVVPFTMIFPKYVPEELKTYPPHLIKMTGENSETEVDILYQTPSGSGDIYIVEVDLVKEWVPNDDHTYLDISGIRVLEQKSFNAILAPGTPETEPNLQYIWSQANIQFNVIVTGYDQTEGRKIVESMIKQ